MNYASIIKKKRQKYVVKHFLGRREREERERKRDTRWMSLLVIRRMADGERITQRPLS
jgi:hypothetical protein